MTLPEPSEPRSLADSLAREARRQLAASAPHLQRLQTLLNAMRRQHGTVPDPDPLDGGSGARVLILLETPGPRMHTGIVSRDNPSGTAANLFRFLRDAGLPRQETLIWNAVPFLIHETGKPNRAPTRTEAQVGQSWLPPLLDLMPRLDSIVCAGKFAQMAIPIMRAHRPALRIVSVPHPSPTYVCTDPAIAPRIVAGLREAAAPLRAAA